MVLLPILEISIYNRNKKRQGGIMNQYIINEKELDEWEAGGMCWSEEKDMQRGIRSNLYQSERDKLEELVSWIEKGECSIDIFYRTQDGRELEAVGIETEGLLKKIAELRQAGRQAGEP
jgi:hypothetical protein